MKILVTGAAGYIGSHVLLELIDRGFTDIHVIDRFLTRSPNWIGPLVYEGFDGEILSQGSGEILSAKYDVIIHLGVYERPEDNLAAIRRLLYFRKHAHLIFASTGESPTLFAKSKFECENEIRSHITEGYTIFRFYNVSGRRREVSAQGNINHLIRRAAMAAKGYLPNVTIFGTDWDTPDGTCVRDYIHASDLATSIVNCIEQGPANTHHECLGSGQGYSVKEVLSSMKKVSKKDFDVIIADRRPGDVASLICPTQYKHITLNHDLDSMCLSAYEGFK